MSHAEHAEAMQRVADGAEPDGAFERAAAGPGAILCAHADCKWRGGALARGRRDLRRSARTEALQSPGPTAPGWCRNVQCSRTPARLTIPQGPGIVACCLVKDRVSG